MRPLDEVVTHQIFARKGRPSKAEEIPYRRMPKLHPHFLGRRKITVQQLVFGLVLGRSVDLKHAVDGHIDKLRNNTPLAV